MLIAWFVCFFPALVSASVVAIAPEDAEAQTAEYPRVRLEYPRVPQSTVATCVGARSTTEYRGVLRRRADRSVRQV